MTFRVASGIFLVASAHGAFAVDVITARYSCERGISVPVAYVNASDGSSAVVLNVEGRQIALVQNISASGARYEWPSDGSGYVWWSKGNAATLSWRNGEDGTETVLLAECKSE